MDPTGATYLVDWSIHPTSVGVGETVYAEATFANTRDLGSHTIYVGSTVDGQTVAVKRLTIPPGERRTVTFRHQFQSPGQYAVGVADEDERAVTVSEAGGGDDDDTTPTPGSGDTDDSTPTPDDGDGEDDDYFDRASPWLLGLAVLGLVVLLVLGGLTLIRTGT